MLIQTGLIDKVLKAVDMESLNSVASPATTITTGIEINGVDYNKDWEDTNNNRGVNICSK